VNLFPQGTAPRFNRSSTASIHFARGARRCNLVVRASTPKHDVGVSPRFLVLLLRPDRPRKMLGLAVSALDRDPRGYRATPERSMLLLDDGTHLAAGSVADAHEKDELNPSAPSLRPSRPGFTPPLRPVGGPQYDLTQFLTFRRMASMSPAQRRNPRAARSPKISPGPSSCPKLCTPEKSSARPSMTRAQCIAALAPTAEICRYITKPIFSVATSTPGQITNPIFCPAKRPLASRISLM
jgi:hypothetical protein